MTTLTTAAGIAQELSTRLEGAIVANGAETDIGVRVYRGRKNVDADSVPCTVLIEAGDTIADRPGRIPAVEVAQNYAVTAYLPCDPNNPNDAAHAAIRDIKRALFKSNATLDGKVVRVSYKGRDIGPRIDGAAIVFCVVHIEVKYVEDLTNP